MHGLPERFRGAVAVATADVDEAAELVDAHDVSTIPHFVLLRSGAEVCTCVIPKHLCFVSGSPPIGCSSGGGVRSLFFVQATEPAWLL